MNNRSRFEFEKKTIAQEWLNKNYSDKSQVKVIDFDNFLDINFIQGNLIIENYPNLYSIRVSGTLDLHNNIPHLEIKNCPSLVRVYLRWNQLTRLDFSNLPNLEDISCDGNKLSSLDISDNFKLRYLLCDVNVQPIKQLSQKIQDQEKALTQLKANETTNQQQITQLAAELQQLKNLKESLAKQFQQKEELLNKSLGDLTTQLEQIKTEKNDLVTKLKDHETTLQNNRSLLDKTNSELINKEQELIKVRDENSSSTASLQEKIINLNEQINSFEEENKKLSTSLSEEKVKNQALALKMQELESRLWQNEVKEAKNNYENLLNDSYHILSKEDKVIFDELMEEIEEVIKNGQENNLYAQKLINLRKQSLQGKLETDVLEKICELKQILIKLEIQREEKLEVKIEISPK